MHYRRLAGTNLVVSEVGFHCGAVGETPEETLLALKRAFQHEISLIETADVYDGGECERLIAQALRGRREEAVLVTKGGLSLEGGALSRNHGAAAITAAIRASLERLETDWIDVYLLHSPDPSVLEDGDLWAALEAARAEGSVRFAGVAARDPGEAALFVESGRVQVVEVDYNLLDHRAEERLLPLALERGVGVLARRPLASGLLTGRYGIGRMFPGGDRRAGASDEEREATWERLQRLSLLEAHGVTLAQAALAFALSHPAVASVLVGMRSPEQVDANAGAPALVPLAGEAAAVIEGGRA